MREEEKLTFKVICSIMHIGLSSACNAAARARCRRDNVDSSAESKRKFNHGASPMAVHPVIADRIRKVHKEEGLTQEVLSQRFGVTIDAVRGVLESPDPPACKYVL